MSDTKMQLKRQDTDNQITAAVRCVVITFFFFHTTTTTMISYCISSNVCRGDSCVTSCDHAVAVPCYRAAGHARAHAAHAAL
jgi:hypothetical protein